MAKHGHSVSGLPSPLFRGSPESSILLSPSGVNIAALANTDTLRFTLSLSRNESYWHLLHSALGPENPSFLSPAPSHRMLKTGKLHLSQADAEALVTGGDKEKHMSRPGSHTQLIPSLSRRMKSLPSDGDYRRMQNRLDKIINGSALSFHSLTLSQSKPVEVSLEQNEWQYLKVKTLGLLVPMKVSLKRTKGKVVCFVSKTQQEPTEQFYDEVHYKDSFTFSEVSMRFKTPWVFLGLKSEEESALTISIRFGIKRKGKPKVPSRLPTLTDLADLRKDDTKRAALAKQVETLLEVRQEVWASKYSNRDFIRENRVVDGKDEDLDAKREVQRQRREKAAKRHLEVLKEKKKHAELMLRRQEMRLEGEAKKRAELEEQGIKVNAEKAGLTLVTFFKATENIYAHFVKRKMAIVKATKEMMAAIVLQRCYKKVLLFLNPKRLVRQHALHHLALFTHFFLPVTKAECKEQLFNAIRESSKAHKVRDTVRIFCNRSKSYLVGLLQITWRRYALLKLERLDTLGKVWNEVLGRLLLESAQKNAKRVRRTKEGENKYMKIDRNQVLLRHLKTCQSRYYQSISEYIQANSRFRKGVKAFIFAKLKKGEDAILPAAPDFKYELTPEEMEKLIQDSVAELV